MNLIKKTLEKIREWLEKDGDERYRKSLQDFKDHYNDFKTEGK